MDVKDHERLYNIRLEHELKSKNSAVISFLHFAL